MNYIFLCLLAVFTAVHLYHSWTDQSKKRPYTKPFLLPLIILYYIFSIKGVASVNTYLIIALVTSWIGDVLLIPKGMKWFALGGISFLVSHITFIYIYISNINFESVNIALIIPAALLYLLVVILIFRTLIPHGDNKPLFIAMALYLIANGTMNIFALMQLISNPGIATITAYIGAALFFISDCSLFLLKFHPKKDLVFKKHFTVMLTYVIGELLITQGIIFLA